MAGRVVVPVGRGVISSVSSYDGGSPACSGGVGVDDRGTTLGEEAEAAEEATCVAVVSSLEWTWADLDGLKRRGSIFAGSVAAPRRAGGWRRGISPIIVSLYHIQNVIHLPYSSERRSVKSSE